MDSLEKIFKKISLQPDLNYDMDENEFTDFQKKLDFGKIIHNSIKAYDSELEKANFRSSRYLIPIKIVQEEVPSFLMRGMIGVKAFSNGLKLKDGTPYTPKVRVQITRDFSEETEDYRISGGISTYIPESAYYFRISFSTTNHKRRNFLENIRLRIGSALTDEL